MFFITRYLEKKLSFGTSSILASQRESYLYLLGSSDRSTYTFNRRSNGINNSRISKGPQNELKGLFMLVWRWCLGKNVDKDNKADLTNSFLYNKGVSKLRWPRGKLKLPIPKMTEKIRGLCSCRISNLKFRLVNYNNNNITVDFKICIFKR